MEIKLNIVPPPSSIQHNMFGDINKMAVDIKSGKRLCVDIGFESKTRVRIAIHLGSNRFAVNRIYPDCKFSLHTTETYNYFTYKKDVHHFFKLNKKQNFNALMEHVKNILNDIFAEYITDAIEVDVWQTWEINEIQQKYL